MTQQLHKLTILFESAELARSYHELATNDPRIKIKRITLTTTINSGLSKRVKRPYGKRGRGGLTTDELVLKTIEDLGGTATNEQLIQAFVTWNPPYAPGSVGSSTDRLRKAGKITFNKFTHVWSKLV